MQQAIIKQCRANYNRLLALLPDVQTMSVGSAVKMKADQFMDLNIDILRQQGTVTQISLAHYYEQHGDLVSDPDMEVMLMHVTQMALPVHFQSGDFYRPCIEGTTITNVKEFNGQSNFLSQWLRNIKMQGHAIAPSTPTNGD